MSLLLKENIGYLYIWPFDPLNDLLFSGRLCSLSLTHTHRKNKLSLGFPLEKRSMHLKLQFVKGFHFDKLRLLHGGGYENIALLTSKN